jgi:hypothetical protein
MFLASGYLWLLILAVPLLWRHLSRPAQILKVSSITFWRASSEDGIEHRRTSTLNYHLFAELLVFLLIVLAASQFTGESSSRVAAVVLDNSPSMRLKNVDGNERLTESHATATQALSSRPESQQLGLFLPGSRQFPLVQGFPGYVSDLVAQWHPHAEPASASQSLQHSINWLISKDASSKSLYYFGDEAISHWPSVPGGIDLVPVTNTAFASNYALLGMTAKRHAYSPDTIEIKAQLGYAGVQQTGLVKWRLEISGKVIREGSSNFENGRSATIPISLPGHLDAQAVAMFLETADSCVADNRYQAEIEVEHPVKVYVSDAYQNLRRAIRAIPGVVLVDSDNRESAQVWVSMEESEVRPLLQFSRQNNATFNFDGREFFQKKHPLLDGIDLYSSALGNIENLGLEEGAEALAAIRGSTILTADPADKRIRAGFDPVSSGFIDQPGFPILITNSLRWFKDGVDDAGDTAEKVAALDPIRVPLHEFLSEPIHSKFITLPLWAFSAGFGLMLALLVWRKS